MDDAAKTLRRFPLVLICSLLCSVELCLTVMNGYSNFNQELIFTFSLGLVLFLALALFSERYGLKQSTVIIANTVLIIALAVYYFTFPERPHPVASYRYVLLVMASHLLVSFAPFVITAEQNGFWQFNRILFLRFLLSLLYSVALFAGLSLALLGTKELLKINIHPDTYLYLLYLTGTFNTWFFLNGIPVDTAMLESDNSFPKGLRLFTMYVLLPLIVVYLLILYLYIFRLLILQSLPDGWVSVLVSSYSVAGIFALLLIWPLWYSEDYPRLRKFVSLFFIALIPLIALMAFAIGIRVYHYGITENRFMIIMLVIWLLLITFYFLFSKIKRIKVIPVTLFIAVLAAGFGPFNAFDTSRKDQMEILQELLAGNGRFKDGKITSSDIRPDRNDQERITDITNYLVNRFGAGVFYPVISDSLKHQFRDSTWNEYVISEMLFEEMQIQAAYAGPSKEHRVLYHEWPEPVDIRGYDYYMTLSLFTYDVREVISDNFHKNAKVNWSYNVPAQVLTVMTDSIQIQINLLQVAENALRASTENNLVISAENMCFEQESEKAGLKMLIRNISIDQTVPGNRIQSLEATVLLRLQK